MAKIHKTDISIGNAPKFDVDIEKGLSKEQVESRKKDKLVNKTTKRVTKSYLRIILDNFVNFFNILLFIIAIFIALAGITQPTFYFFVLILTANIAIGLFQDIHARILVDKLRVVSSLKARVIRDGQEIEIESNQVVLSDIIILKTGDEIIADGVIVDGSIEVNESILTGESIDVKKNKKSEVFAGSFVTSGYAKMVVSKVGKANYVEKLQEEAKTFKRPKSEILRSLNTIFKILGAIVIGVGGTLIITYVIAYAKNGDAFWPLYEAQTAVKSIAGSLVSMIPTGMYLLTSTTLAVGVIRLARKRMLVQELYSIEMLARVDTLCLDKTGTITDGTMNVKDVVPVGKVSKEELEKILISIVKSTGDTNGTANAILKAYSGLEAFDVHQAFAFNSKKKLSAIRAKDGYSYALGAREFVGKITKKVADLCTKHEEQAERVLVIGRSNKPYEEDAKMEFEVLGVLILEDHIRDDAYANIEWFKNNGVDIKIISGDNALSVSKIAMKVGVKDAERFVSLEGMSNEEVAEIADNYTVFGRVSPNQKEALVRALREKGHVVAMTGDGVNDILALKSADCSIAMASGSAAARNASHLVSLDSNFSNLPQVVGEGRRVINNLQRTCSLFLVKTIFAVVLTVVFMVNAWIRGVPNSQQIYPFTTPNMFVWEFATIGIASLFLSLQPNNEKLSGGFAFNIFKKAVPSGISMIVIVLLTFAISWLFPDYLSLDAARTISVLCYSAFSFVVLFSVCWKFDLYRGVLFGAMLIFAIGAFVLDALLPSTGKTLLFDLSYGALDNTTWWLTFIIFAVSIPVFIGLLGLFKYIENRYNERNK